MKGGMIGIGLGIGIVGMMIGLVAGEGRVVSTSSFGKCFSSCFSLCLLDLNSPVTCSMKCLAKCVNSPSHLTPNSLHSCKLGCALKFCSNFISNQNPDVVKVESCVNSCPVTCTGNY